MSHSAHRYGTRGNLQNDYVLYARTSDAINREGSGPKLRKIFEIILSEKPVNFGHTRAGSYAGGLQPEAFAKTLDRAIGVQCVFSSKEKVKRALKKLKKSDTGISIVVTGLIAEITEMAKDIVLKPHTAFLSLGIHGEKSLLPDEKILEISSMCGHGMVSSKLTNLVMEKVKSDAMTPKEGSLLLAKQCPCGIFNIERCEVLLNSLTLDPPSKR